jgi:acyl-CoA thioester hydrolase
MSISELEVRVRYAETDQMGIAHHASYLVWFEAGRTEFIRSRGRSYAQIEADGWLLVVVEARCRYVHPARYDDVLCVRTRLAAMGPATVEFAYEIVRKHDGKALAEGATRHAAIGRTGRPGRIPDELRRLLGTPTEPPPGGRRPGRTVRGGEPGEPANKERVRE